MFCEGVLTKRHFTKEERSTLNVGGAIPWTGAPRYRKQEIEEVWVPAAGSLHFLWKWWNGANASCPCLHGGLCTLNGRGCAKQVLPSLSCFCWNFITTKRKVMNVYRHSIVSSMFHLVFKTASCAFPWPFFFPVCFLFCLIMILLVF